MNLTLTVNWAVLSTFNDSTWPAPCVKFDTFGLGWNKGEKVYDQMRQVLSYLASVMRTMFVKVKLKLSSPRAFNQLCYLKSTATQLGFSTEQLFQTNIKTGGMNFICLERPLKPSWNSLALLKAKTVPENQCVIINSTNSAKKGD